MIDAPPQVSSQGANSVVCWFLLDMVDYHHWIRPLLRLKFQAELLFDCLPDRRFVTFI
jgi:hypothetical protein